VRAFLRDGERAPPQGDGSPLAHLSTEELRRILEIREREGGRGRYDRRLPED
jgi:hypothetical protein